MPRYFFHCADGTIDRDEEGQELPNLAAAQLAAVQYAGIVLQGSPQDLWHNGSWRVEVTDEHGILLFIVLTNTVSMPIPDAKTSALVN